MTKEDLVEKIALASDLTKKDAEVLFEVAIGEMMSALHRGEKIEVRGFGSFRIRQRAARRGRNPKTGVAVNIPAKQIPYFTPGKELRKAIASSSEEPQEKIATPSS